jgi:photosystem II stability/assembly factor-like uncharacterized protein
MRSQHWTLLAGMVILALLAAACAPANIAPPTSAPVAATTSAPTAPATTAATAAATAATSAANATVPPIAAPATNTAAPSPTVPAAPSPTSAPTATPVANAIVHLSAGTAITLTSIHMLDASAGWATGGLASTGDHVLTTNDGGQTWHDVTPQQVAPAPDQGMPSAAAGFFGNATTAWVVYGNFVTAAPASAIVFRTSDGGQTWTGSQPIDLSAIGAADFFQPSDIRFLPDAKTGWFIAHLGVGMNHDYFTIMKTTDGGQTWTRLIDPTSGGPQSCQKTGLHFTDAQNGWLTGDCQGVAPGLFFMHSGDGGATWTQASLPAPASQPDIFTRQDAGCGTYYMRFFDPQNAQLSVSCLILGANVITSTHFIYSTQDGGQSWTSNPSPSRSLTFINPQTGWALPYGENNAQPPYALSQTQDGGKTWTTVKQLAWTGQLSFVDNNNGWAVAQADQAMSFVKTTDGGHTWQAVNPKIAP